MNFRKSVPLLIVILVLTVPFASVVTIHPAAGGTAPFPLVGTALMYKGVAYCSYAPNEYLSASSNSSLDAVKGTGANYASLLVTQYLSTNTSSTIYSDANRTPTDAAVIAAIDDVHARGMGVMLKPQLQTEDGHGADMLNPTNKLAWFASYATFINHYAQIAQDHGVELFCVGTELSRLDGNYQPNWSSVIRGVRAVYSGPLTYSAEFLEYKNTCFWGLLDYAGISAYFPLSDAQTPSVADLIKGWSNYDYSGTVHNWLQELETWQASIGKPVIFTEIGYRSVDYAAHAPWNYLGTPSYNGQAQANCYEAALQVFENKPWFAGMFWWGWSCNPNKGGAKDVDYTPHNKPAQCVLTEHWSIQGLCLNMLRRVTISLIPPLFLMRQTLSFEICVLTILLRLSHPNSNATA